MIDGLIMIRLECPELNSAYPEQPKHIVPLPSPYPFHALFQYINTHGSEPPLTGIERLKRLLCCGRKKNTIKVRDRVSCSLIQILWKYRFLHLIHPLHQLLLLNTTALEALLQINDIFERTICDIIKKKWESPQAPHMHTLPMFVGWLGTH